MLKFDPNQKASAVRAAATLLVARDAASGIELFCVRRHGKSAFLGGAVVFPGGKLDDADADEALLNASNGIHPRASLFAADNDAHALAICACRESLEEAALLPTQTPLPHDKARELQRALADGATLPALLNQHRLTLDTAALVPFARWVTPKAEQRRFDARFFMARVPAGQRGQHDAHETTSGLWASPRATIDAFMAGELFLAPPTLRTLELLVDAADVDGAFAIAAKQSLRPICPQVINFDPLTLALPGDPQHEETALAIDGPTRFVMEQDKLVSRDPA